MSMRHPGFLLMEVMIGLLISATLMVPLAFCYSKTMMQQYTMQQMLTAMYQVTSYTESKVHGHEPSTPDAQIRCTTQPVPKPDNYTISLAALEALEALHMYTVCAHDANHHDALLYTLTTIG